MSTLVKTGAPPLRGLKLGFGYIFRTGVKFLQLSYFGVLLKIAIVDTSHLFSYFRMIEKQKILSIVAIFKEEDGSGMKKDKINKLRSGRLAK